MDSRFANHGTSGPQGTSAAQVITAALTNYREHIVAKDLTVDLDIDSTLNPIASAQSLAVLLDRVLSLAISRCDTGGEIVITAVETDRGIEIEVADSGEDTPEFLEGRRHGAFAVATIEQQALSPHHTTPMREQTQNHDVHCARCPQGGLSWTIVERQPVAAVKVA